MSKQLSAVLFTPILLSLFLLVSGFANPDNGDVIDLLRPVLQALVDGHPGIAAGFALVFLAALARRYGGKRWAFFNTDAGGTLLVLVGSAGGALATLLTGGATFSLGLLYQVLAMAVSASGGYSLVKRLIIEPIVRPLMKRAPAWLQPMFALVLWVFDKPDPVTEAVAAGNDAVAAKPPTGAAGIVGDSRDVQ